jgi:hypothetical protein
MPLRLSALVSVAVLVLFLAPQPRVFAQQRPANHSVFAQQERPVLSCADTCAKSIDSCLPYVIAQDGGGENCQINNRRYTFCVEVCQRHCFPGDGRGGPGRPDSMCK